MAPFVDQVHPTMVIKGILSAYPFSLGLFREFLQNSDDAGASKQIFVLDQRSHNELSAQEGFLGADACGPSFIAYNNAPMQEDDWLHLQRSHDSSKSTKSSKIGKYGVGFRSCYHITDTPQIMSGDSFAWFDPINWGGGRVPIQEEHRKPFEPVLSGSGGLSMNGTAFRLPLRTSTSVISDTAVPPSTLLNLLKEFIDKELPMILLFLQSVSEVEIQVLDSDGTSVTLATALLAKGPQQHVSQTSPDSQSSTNLCEMSVTRHGLEKERTTWRIFSSVQVASGNLYKHLEKQFPRLPELLTKHKLRPEVSLAFPLGSSREFSGRLFTYLPLPIVSGLPFHMHSLFALTQSRQHLRNSDERGLVPGSDDSFLVEWNKALIRLLVPQAVSQLLLTLIRDVGVKDVFRAWPVKGESSVWASLLADTVHVVAREMLPVWPVSSGVVNEPVARFVGINSVSITAQDSSTEEKAVVQALLRCGMSICLVPTPVLQALQAISDIHCHFLSPREAHMHLQKSDILSRLATSTSDEKAVVLSYLGQANDVLLMTGLPLIPSRSGTYLTLCQSGDSSMTHTLMDSNELALFGVFDDSAICLDDLPVTVRRAIQNDGPKSLNVRNLSARIIGELLSVSPSPIGLDTVGEPVQSITTEWLNRFWRWMKHKNFARERTAVPGILSSLPLIPTFNGLRRLHEVVFGSAQGLHPALLRSFSSLQMPFLAEAFDSQCLSAITLYGNVKYCESIEDILAFTRGRELCALEMQDARILLDFFAGKLALKTLSPNEVRDLRSLPIYPILFPSHSAQTAIGPAVVGSISESYNSARLVSGFNILPTIPGRVWIENNPSAGSTATVLKSLGFTLPNTYSPMEVIEDALDVFDSQSLPLQEAFVRYLQLNERRVPKDLLQRLASTKFVSVLGGTTACPQDIIDPKSMLSSLFTMISEELYVAEEPKSQLLEMLSSLGLLRRKLDSTIVNNRIRWISGHNDDAMARRLLSLLHSQPLVGSQILEIDLSTELRWLPTLHGLKSHAECRDLKSAMPAICDETYTFLSPEVFVPAYLYQHLGWLDAIPFDVLLQQLDRTLTGSRHVERLLAIFEQIVQDFEHCTHAQITRLLHLIKDKEWLPVDGKLAGVERIILQERKSGHFKLPGFHAISVTSRPQKEKFLKLIGCSDRPSDKELLKQLDQLKRDSQTKNVTSDVVRVLQYLHVSRLSEEQVKSLVAPDIDEHLQPLEELYFNDTIAIYQDSMGLDGYIAHRKVSKTVANNLGLQFLGQLILPDFGTRDFGETIRTRIRNILKEYTERQMLLETLANACDAGATEFGILLDSYRPIGTALLSDRMGSLNASPAVVLYNNSIFSSSDWEAICATGDSLKGSQEGKLGQFGLGALSMFHITEMVTIVSGDRVMFMDPALQFLPARYHQRKFMLTSISHLGRTYPDHLRALHGLFEFDRGKTTYNGTLFRLPLRSQAGQLSSRTFKIQDLEEITNNFLDDAQKSMLFTRLIKVSCAVRTSERVVRPRWSLFAARSKVLSNGVADIFTLQTTRMKYTSMEDVTTQADWIIASTVVEVPQTLYTVDQPKRLKSAMVGIAVSCDPSIRAARSSSFFSTLPLPISTSLPVEISASFIISSDRRGIRDDNFDHVEVQYNRWLVSHALPPVYLFAISCLPSIQADLWPSAMTGPPPLAMCLVEALYDNHLMTTALEWRLFNGVYGGHGLTAKEVVLIPNDLPAPVRQFLDILQPLNVADLLAPPELETYFRRAGLKFLNPKNLASILHTAQQDSMVTFAVARQAHKVFTDLVKYLLQDEGMENVLGLQLLPLADSSWTTFSRSGDRNMYAIPHAMRDVVPAELIVHPDYITERSTYILESGLNVTKLTPAVMRSFMCKNLTPSQVCEVTNTEATWIKKLWAHFALIPKGTVFEDFPLIPTTRPSIYVSKAYCNSSAVIVLADSVNLGWLTTVLNSIGAHVVLTNPSFKHGVAPSKQSLFEDILQFLSNSLISLPQIFAQIPGRARELFIDWLRGHIASGGSTFKGIMRKLPVWIEWNPKDTTAPAPCAATNVACMLPAGVSRQIALDFMSVPFVEFSPDLRNHLDVTPLSLQQLQARLRPIKVVTDPADLNKYCNLVKTLLEFPTAQASFAVPNGRGDVVQSNTLYRREPLFEAAFDSGRESTFFLHSTHQEFETALVQKGGLQTSTSLTAALFRRCVLTFQEYQGEDQVAKASTIFTVYCEDLALQGSRNAELAWGSLSALRFIPAMDLAQRRHPPLPASLNVNLTQYIKALPPVVSPNEVVIDDGIASAGVESLQYVAWTQRSRVVLDSRTILLVNPSFGQPSAEDVVNHLVALVRMTQDHPKLQSRLWTDLRDTYFWLTSKCSRNEVIRMLRSKEVYALFLNVDDPTVDDWSWSCSRDLFFNDGSNWEPEDAQPVRRCLLPFRPLLVKLGVQDVVQVEARAVPKVDIPVRGKYIQMRDQGRYVDVVFQTCDGSSLYGHRLLLSAVSDYFWALFNEGFSEGRPADSDNPVEVSVEEPYECLKLVLDAVYNDELSSTEDISTTVLLEALELSARWSLSNVFGELQGALGKRIQLDTFETIAEYAERLGALPLLEATREFTSKNRNSILWHESRAGDSEVSSMIGPFSWM